MTRWIHCVALSAALAFGTVLALPAEAGGLRVTPLRVDLGPDQRQASLRLQNLGNAEPPVEVTVLRWSQDAEGIDQYAPAESLFIAPPIVSIPPGGEQTVRLALLQLPENGQEASYRVYVEELAPPAGQQTATGMHFRMRFGIPTFVAPESPAPPKLSLDWRRDDSGTLIARLSNDGGTHLKVTGIELHAGPPPEAGGHLPKDVRALSTHTEAFYLLPGASSERHLGPVSAEGPLSLHLLSDYHGRSDQPGFGGHGHYWFRLRGGTTDTP